jgi:hypothetical protein
MVVRKYKIGQTGTPMTGEQFVKRAQSLFKTEVHGFGASGRPTTLKKALNFVDRELSRQVYTKSETETEWRWIGLKPKKAKRR